MMLVYHVRGSFGKQVTKQHHSVSFVENFILSMSLLWRHLLIEHSLHVYHFPHQ